VIKHGLNNSEQGSKRKVLKISKNLRLPPGFECGFGNRSGRNNLCHRDLCYKLIRYFI
jgi:hypothetical protein